MVPAGLVDYLSLLPEEQRANYRKRVEDAAAKDPTDGAVLLRLVELELEEGHADAAADAARRIAALKPDPASLAGAGKALLDSNQNVLAKDLLARAAAAAPSADVDLDLALAVFRVDGAPAGLARLDGEPASARGGDYYLVRAQMLNASGKLEEAAASLEAALRAAPKRADLYWQAAAFLAGNGKTDDALRMLDQALRDLPDAREIPLAKALTLEISGQTGPALDLLKQVQTRWPEWAAGWAARGMVLENHGSFEEAWQALNTAVSLGARSPEAYYYLADASLRSTPKRMDAADSAAAVAFKGLADDAWTLTLTGRMAVAKGDYATAVERLKRAISLRPDFAEAHRLLGESYKAQGQPQQAEAEEQRSKQGVETNPPYLNRLFQSKPLAAW